MTTVRALVKALVIAAEWTLFAAAAAYGLIHGDWLIVGIASAFAAAAALAVVRRRHRSALVVPPAAERHAVRHGLGVRRTRRIR